jgi:hypothetical protein
MNAVVKFLALLWITGELTGCALLSPARDDSSHRFEAISQDDVMLGMPMSQVQRAWGQPRWVDSAGLAETGNQRWTYVDGGTLTGRTRIVYFEEGRVVGWDTR